MKKWKYIELDNFTTIKKCVFSYCRPQNAANDKSSTT